MRDEASDDLKRVYDAMVGKAGGYDVDVSYGQTVDGEPTVTFSWSAGETDLPETQLEPEQLPGTVQPVAVCISTSTNDETVTRREIPRVTVVLRAASTGETEIWGRV